MIIFAKPAHKVVTIIHKFLDRTVLNQMVMGYLAFSEYEMSKPTGFFISQYLAKWPHRIKCQSFHINN